MNPLLASLLTNARVLTPIVFVIGFFQLVVLQQPLPNIVELLFGLALVLIGMAFMVAEMFMPSFGALGIGGLAAFVAGSIILLDTELSAFSLSLPLIFHSVSSRTLRI